jgi:hypothetical protein
VKRELSTLVPTLAECVVVLLHDVNLRERVFGVCTLWPELTEQFLESLRGPGLGVLRPRKTPGAGSQPPFFLGP